MARRGWPLAQTDFPLYTVRTLGDKHFLVAGGGGQAKTGVANAIDIYEFRLEDGCCIAKRVNHYETGEAAVMNSCVLDDERNYVLATGQEGNCQLYNLRYKMVALKDVHQSNSDTDNVRKRKGNQTKSGDYNAAPKTVMFDVEKGPCIQTDFSKDGPFQKVTVFSRNRELIVTGGADGCIRVWKHQSMAKACEIKAHTNEIDDLDINPPANRIASVSKDNHAYLWNVKDGTKKLEIKWTKNTDVSYRFRSCRYGIISDKADQHRLFTTHIPSTRGAGNQKSPHCYLTKWNCTDYTPMLIQDTGEETLSALAVSENGNYVGVGTIQGSVSVYIAFSLQRLYHLKQAHGIFVTGLDFTRSTESAKSVIGNMDFSLLSISADNHVLLHQEAPRNTYSVFWVILGFFMVIYILYTILMSV